jgi:hypothetical protein
MSQQPINSTTHTFKTLPAPRVSSTGFGILNKHGEFWSPGFFKSPQQAIEYLEGYFQNGVSLEEFSVVPVCLVLQVEPARVEHTIAVYQRDPAPWKASA